MLFAAGILSLLIWIYLLFGRGGFWRIQHAASLLPDNEIPARIAVIIPARNEADVIGRAITSLLRQSGPDSIHIFLVDDNSTDGTAQAAREAAIAAGREEMLTVIAGRPLASGWSGKLWAVQQGIEVAREMTPDFFLLTDADIEHAPDSLSSLVVIAHVGPCGLASY